MSEYKVNQKGFSAIEGLLVVIALTLIVGVGAYVLNSKKKTNAPVSNTLKTTPLTPKANTPAVTDDRLSLTKEQIGFTAKYPKDWKFEVYSGNDASNKTFYLTAPNTKLAVGGASESVTAGAKIAIYKSAGGSITTIAGLKQANTSETRSYAKKTYTDTKVGGEDAVSYDYQYESPLTHYVTFFVGSESYDISIQSDVLAKPEFAKVFNEFMSSINFK